jgi:hypothetical protein
MTKQCWLPYYHAEVDLQGQVLPCCKYTEPWIQNLDTYHTHGRQEFEQQTLPNGCTNCNQITHSYRDIKMKEFRKIWIEPVQPSLLSLNLTLDNTCSNTCIMCNETYSTTIGMLRKNYIKLYNDFTNIKFDKLEYLTLSGGDPLQSKNLIALCERIATAPLKTVNVITSLARATEKNITALENLKKALSFRVSIDGPWDLHSWIRGNNYQDFIKNLNRVKHHSINWQVTLGSYNIFALPETLEFLETLVPGQHIQPSIVYGPKPAFIVASMPLEIRLKIKQKLLNYKGRPNSVYIIKAALELLDQESDRDWQSCMTTIEELAQLRSDHRKLVDFIDQYLNSKQELIAVQ